VGRRRERVLAPIEMRRLGIVKRRDGEIADRASQRHPRTLTAQREHVLVVAETWQTGPAAGACGSTLAQAGRLLVGWRSTVHRLIDADRTIGIAYGAGLG
jgi:hypothetical protein